MYGIQLLLYANQCSTMSDALYSIALTCWSPSAVTSHHSFNQAFIPLRTCDVIYDIFQLIKQMLQRP